MATVKIIKDSDETFEEVEDQLIKALQVKDDDKFLTKRFDDPLMNLLVKELDNIFLEIYPKMIQEILDIIK
ncbi:MAG TPA: hypothetical protein PLJ37_00920 [Chitinophagales bacterium]|nr:hypothetical protein [Chitinophagales bacterium]HMW93513.1 hypothetical protein [Chitinophagales bacterium]HMZ92989.1 hypothetical protein [Chitinophagales bacterium]HNG25948.1 hypothetical protein [Chitinophagales bacterium]